MLIKVIMAVVGIGLLIGGYYFHLPLLMVIGGALLATVALYLISAIEGIGKSEEEKERILQENIKQFDENMSRGLNYTATKMSMNDAINKDIQKDIEKAIKSGRR